MKRNCINLHLEKTDEVLGFFGKAQLIRRHTGCHGLQGGTALEQEGVRGWCDRFAPELVFVGDTILVTITVCRKRDRQRRRVLRPSTRKELRLQRGFLPVEQTGIGTNLRSVMRIKP